MKAQLNAITIAVKDLARLKDFYINTFGWEIMNENPEIVIFNLGQIMLSLYQDSSHSTYIGVPQGKHFHPKFYLTINTNSPEETDQLFADLKIKGVKIIKEPQAVFWGGYSGFIADPEDNYWEICYNPFPKFHI